MPAPVISHEVKGLEEVEALLQRLDEEGFKKALKGYQNWGDWVCDVAQQTAPTDKGELASTGKIKYTSTGFIILYTSGHARAVHYGYVRHFVRPKHRKVLRWEVDRKGRLSVKKPLKQAQFAYSKGHYVPGRKARSKPNPWLFKAIDAGVPHLKTFILEEFNKIEGGVA